MEVKKIPGPRGCRECFALNPDDILKDEVFVVKWSWAPSNSTGQSVLCKDHARLLRNKLNRALEA